MLTTRPTLEEERASAADAGRWKAGTRRRWTIAESMAGCWCRAARLAARTISAGAKVVTKRAPTEAELADLRFAWLVCKHVKSNAIVLAKDGMVVGVGAGQMSRVDSVHLAMRKAGERGRGAVLAVGRVLSLPRQHRRGGQGGRDGGGAAGRLDARRRLRRGMR